MTDQASPAEVRARLEGGAAYGTWGSALEHRRYVVPAPRKPGGQFKCRCGCNGRETHWGRANGVTLTAGCELSMRRWVRDPHA